VVDGIEWWGLQYRNATTFESAGPVDVLNNDSGVTYIEAYDVNGNGELDVWLPTVTVVAEDVQVARSELREELSSVEDDGRSLSKVRYIKTLLSYEISEDFQPVVVHQIGFNTMIGAPIGFVLSGGIILDSKGTWDLYWNYGFFHGFDLSLGVEYIQSRSNVPNSSFNIYEIKGKVVNNNIGLYIFDFGYGTDTQGAGNYGEDRKATYSSYSFGVSFGIPVGFTRSVETTSFIFGK